MNFFSTTPLFRHADRPGTMVTYALCVSRGQRQYGGIRWEGGDHSVGISEFRSEVVPEFRHCSFSPEFRCRAMLEFRAPRNVRGFRRNFDGCICRRRKGTRTDDGRGGMETDIRRMNLAERPCKTLDIYLLEIQQISKRK